jgi:hypothetical protein
VVHLTSQGGPHTDGTFAIFPRPHEQSWGISFVQLPEPFAHSIKVRVVELAKLGRETMVDCARLTEGSDHPSIGLAEGYVPRADLGPDGRGTHEVEAVRELLEDDHWARE